MKEKMKEAFLLTDQEREFLMMARGIRCYYGFSETSAPMDRSRGTQCLFRLMKKGLIRREEEAFKIYEDLSRCLDLTGKAEEALLVTAQECPGRMIYMAGEEAAVWEVQPLRPHTVCVWSCKSWEWAMDLLEDGYFSGLPGLECSAALYCNRSGRKLRQLTQTALGLSVFCRWEEGETIREAACEPEKLPVFLEQWRKGELL